jgi:uncharacterized protein
MENPIVRKLLVASIVVASVYFLLHLAVIPLATVLDRSSPSGETPTDWGYKHSSVSVREPGFSRATAWYIETKAPKGQIILMAHNGGDKSHPLMRWSAGFLLDHGYNVVLTDLRGQGESGGLKTYGAGEAIDAANLVARVLTDHPNLPVGGLGYSLGAAALIRAMGLVKSLEAVAAFAPYSRMDRDLVRQEITYQTGGSWTGTGIMPGLLAGGFRLWAFSFSPIPQPIEVAEGLDRRGLLVMHFRGDPELPVRYSEELASTNSGAVTLHVYDGERHVPSRRTAAFEEDYMDRVVSFFDRWL